MLSANYSNSSCVSAESALSDSRVILYYVAIFKGTLMHLQFQMHLLEERTIVCYVSEFIPVARDKKSLLFYSNLFIKGLVKKKIQMYFVNRTISFIYLLKNGK